MRLRYLLWVVWTCISSAWGRANACGRLCRDVSHQSGWHLLLADPDKCDQGQVFVIFVNFYQWFIEDFSHVSKPLHQLTKKLRGWRWTEAEQKGLWGTQVAHNVDPHPHAAQPGYWIPTRNRCFRYATGAVLSHCVKDNKWPLVGFTSKSFSDAERNYKIHNKELLSVIQGLEEWRHILEGTQNTIEILNNHRNLMYFWTCQIRTTGKHTGPYFWLSWLLSHSKTRVTLCQTGCSLTIGQTIWLRRKTTVTRWCYQLLNSTNLPSWEIPGGEWWWPSHVTTGGLRGKHTWTHLNCTDWDDWFIWALKELGTKWGLCSDKWQEKDGLVLYRGKI